jgi:hypothetical protein
MYAATTLKSYGPIPEKWDAQWRDWDDARFGFVIMSARELGRQAASLAWRRDRG